MIAFDLQSEVRRKPDCERERESIENCGGFCCLERESDFC